jgi:hypothetical protein
MRWDRTITVIGCHVGGEENDVIVGGVLPPPGATMFEKKRHLETQDDQLRRWLLHEPRGKPTLCVNLVLPPTHPDADAGLIIMESTDYPPMSGSNTICTVTVLLETGMLPMVEPVTRVTLDTPAGLVTAEARCRDGRVESVAFTNVPSFVTHLDAGVEVPGLGTVRVDVAYGGAFFALVDAGALGFSLAPCCRSPILRIPASTPSPSSSSPRRSRDRRRRRATPSSSRPAAWIARPAAPAPARDWPFSTRAGSWLSGRDSFRNRSSVRSFPRASSARRASPAGRPSSRKSAARPGSPASSSTASIAPIPSSAGTR